MQQRSLTISAHQATAPLYFSPHPSQRLHVPFRHSLTFRCPFSAIRVSVPLYFGAGLVLLWCRFGVGFFQLPISFKFTTRQATLIYAATSSPRTSFFPRTRPINPQSFLFSSASTTFFDLYEV